MAKYEEIAGDLEHQIRSGALRPGDELKSESELSEEYNVSRNTVRNALRTLLNRGLVETSQGRSTTVAQQMSLSVTTLSKDPTTGRAGGEEAPYIQILDAQFSPEEDVQLSRLEVQMLQAEPKIASALGIAAESFIIARRQELQVHNKTRAVRISYYPYSLIEAGAHEISLPVDMADGVIQYLRDTVGYDEVGYQDTVIMRAADRDEIALFGLPKDGRVGVLETYRVGYTQNAVPIRVTVTTYRADSHVLVNNVGNVPPARLQNPFVPDEKRPEPVQRPQE
ncbi:GntR family transcriptional regulator [Actinocorallia sp. A-T 12471]|uniref:GntR family transcriptional regulator n=1 Tax=Actinocorallia sp. A-T 12471 TaxID=3089813 RepID=UPI0029D2C567|nr:GntR family transcriptional regulator [Actinocorallia sp. A-T 12471]MDX6738462.1 GntR family transcriptional regulator [Actinocorallia sp. A-T 12471]